MREEEPRMAESPQIDREEWMPPRRRWHDEDGRAMLAALRTSGDSVAVFAHRHGIKVARVRKWITRLARRAATVPETAKKVRATFAPVRLIASRAAPDSWIE